MPFDDSETVGNVAICGDDLLSITVADSSLAQALAEQLRKTGEWMEAAAGIDSVVVQFDAAAIDCAAASQRVAEILDRGIAPLQDSGELIEIPVVYGGEFGPDFDDVCRQQDLSAAELIELHTGSDYPVDLVGFTPGFAFIGGLDDKLNVPRRMEPRQQVEAGSVGIADGRTGLYALAVPGGWQIIGRTPLKLFDASASPPNLVGAGMRVRFVAVSADEAGL